MKYPVRNRKIKHSKLIAVWASVLAVASIFSIGFSAWIVNDNSSIDTSNITVNVADINNFGSYLELNTDHGDNGYETISIYGDYIFQGPNVAGRPVNDPNNPKNLILGIYLRLDISKFNVSALNKILLNTTLSITGFTYAFLEETEYSYFYNNNPNASEYSTTSQGGKQNNYIQTETNKNWTKRVTNTTDLSSSIALDITNLSDDDPDYNWSEFTYAYIRILYTLNSITISSSPVKITYNFSLLTEAK